MCFEPVDLGPIARPSQITVVGLTGHTELLPGYAIHLAHFGEDGAQPCLVRNRAFNLDDQAVSSGSLFGWALDELAFETVSNHEVECILGLHPELHDAHVWAWMDDGLQELIDSPINRAVTRLDEAANAWRNPSSIKSWPDPSSDTPF